MVILAIPRQDPAHIAQLPARVLQPRHDRVAVVPGGQGRNAVTTRCGLVVGWHHTRKTTRIARTRLGSFSGCPPPLLPCTPAPLAIRPPPPRPLPLPEAPPGSVVDSTCGIEVVGVVRDTLASASIACIHARSFKTKHAPGGVVRGVHLDHFARQCQRPLRQLPACRHGPQVLGGLTVWESQGKLKGIRTIGLHVPIDGNSSTIQERKGREGGVCGRTHTHLSG